MKPVLTNSSSEAMTNDAWQRMDNILSNGKFPVFIGPDFTDTTTLKKHCNA